MAVWLSHLYTHTHAATKRSKGRTGRLYNPSFRIASLRKGDKKNRDMGSLWVDALINRLGFFLRSFTQGTKQSRRSCKSVLFQAFWIEPKLNTEPHFDRFYLSILLLTENSEIKTMIVLFCQWPQGCLEVPRRHLEYHQSNLLQTLGITD